MVIAMVPVVTLSTGAVDIPGDWDTFRDPEDYDKTEAFCPAAGYAYTADGFTIVPADYTGITPYLAIQSKEKVNLKDGVYLEFRVDNYSYEADHWIAFTLWDTVNARPGNDRHGQGWLNLNRTPGQGGAGACESSSEKTSNRYGNVSITPRMDADGREIYTLEVEWTGGAYDIKVCGVTVGGSRAGVTDHLESLDPNGEFYVGIHMHSGVKSGVAAGTITKFGTSADDATVPTGSDSKEPEENLNFIADFEDCPAPEAGKPALLWDAAKSSMSGDPMGSSLDITAKGDLSYHFKMGGNVGFMTWPIKQSLSYRAEEYPVLAIMFRDFLHEGGSLWWYTGEFLAADEQHMMTWSSYATGKGGQYSAIYGEDEEYTLVIIDLSTAKDWGGRINGLRLDFASTYWEDQDGEWDICYMGMFDTVDNAMKYADDYTGMSAVTEPEEESGSAAPEESSTAPEESSSEPEESSTVAPVESETKAPEKKGGCGSVVATGAVVAVLAAAAAAVALKKKN
jgi:hypothetical protein